MERDERMELAKSLATEKTEVGRFESGDAGAGSALALLAIFRVPLVAIFHRAGALLDVSSSARGGDRSRSPSSNDAIANALRPETANATEGFFHSMETTLLG